MYIVTVKLPKNPSHNPHRKVVGKCPVSNTNCTDITGEHHSLQIEAATGGDAEYQVHRKYGADMHITRIEAV